MPTDTRMQQCTNEMQYLAGLMAPTRDELTGGELQAQPAEVPVDMQVVPDDAPWQISTKAHQRLVETGSVNTHRHLI